MDFGVGLPVTRLYMDNSGQMTKSTHFIPIKRLFCGQIGTDLRRRNYLVA